MQLNGVGGVDITYDIKKNPHCNYKNISFISLVVNRLPNTSVFLLKTCISKQLLFFSLCQNGILVYFCLFVKLALFLSCVIFFIESTHSTSSSWTWGSI